MARYKMVYDLIEEWVREVPWLDQFETKGKDKGGRSKVAKRIIVARGIKDVVQFQEEIWRKKVEAQGKLDVALEEGGDDNSDDDTLSITSGLSGAKRMDSSQEPLASAAHASKKRRVQCHGLDDASQFLLNPLNSSLPAITDPSHLSPDSRSPATLPLPLTSYLLTASPSTLSLSGRPTRLQLLVAEREGGADDVADDELFAEGELDGLVRSEEEVKRLKDVFGWEEATDMANEPDSAKKAPSSTKKSGTRRVDMDALSKVLQGDLDGDNDDMHQLDFDITNTAGLEEIEDWRPPSPSRGAFAYSYDGMDRYDEEC